MKNQNESSPDLPILSEEDVKSDPKNLDDAPYKDVIHGEEHLVVSQLPNSDYIFHGVALSSVKLPDYFHVKVRSFINAKLPCHSCKAPQCSCSGYHRARVSFLPGEREWIESSTTFFPSERNNGKFKNGDSTYFNVSGDCSFLSEDKTCMAGYYRPFECISFPFCPVVENGELVPFFAENCTIHPANLSRQWVAERWKAWQYIFSVIPEWVINVYDPVPCFEETKDDRVEKNQ